MTINATAPPCHQDGIPAPPRNPMTVDDHLQNVESMDDNFSIRTNQNEEPCHGGDANESSLPGSSSLSNHPGNVNDNHDDDEDDVLQVNHTNYNGGINQNPLDNPLRKNDGSDHCEHENPDDDDDDDMTVIPLTTFSPPRFGMMTTTTTFIPPPPPPMHTIVWLEQNTADMEQLRRRIIQVTLQRVQRNAFLTMACLCLVPLLLALVILVAARELVGRGSHCQDDVVGAMNLTCRKLPRRFLNAFASQCVCDGVAMATRTQFNGREL